MIIGIIGILLSGAIPLGIVYIATKLDYYFNRHSYENYKGKRSKNSVKRNSN